MPEDMSSLGRRGVSYVLFMKLTAITVLIMLTIFGRGFTPALVVAVLVVPLWLLTEKVMNGTCRSTLWKSIEEREEFSRLPLKRDINKMKGARKGQKAKQAILEGRLKDEIFYTLKNEYNLSEGELKDLKKDPNSMSERIDNEKLIEYLKNAKDLDELKRPNGEEQVELFSEESNTDFDGKEPGFENKMKSAVAELERIHYVKEDR